MKINEDISIKNIIQNKMSILRSSTMAWWKSNPIEFHDSSSYKNTSDLRGGISLPAMFDIHL